MPRKTPAERPVVHAVMSCNIPPAGGDPPPITVEEAKRLLGWTTNEKEARAAGLTTHLLRDRERNKVWCLNNILNRPLHDAVVLSLIEEILYRWELNGESIIIGRTGLVLNGQHTLIALILAEQIRLQALEGMGVERRRIPWEGPIQIKKVIIYGVEERDEVINTMDTCKPRSVADVVYRSRYFRGQKLSARLVRVLSRITEYAIRLLWFRTGAVRESFSPRRTPSESLEFLSRHTALLNCVKHVYRLYEGAMQANSQLLGPGYAAGMMYLMACSSTDPGDYRAAERPNEELLDFERWKLAEAFWEQLITGESLKEVRYALGYLRQESDPTHPPTLEEKTTVVAKAWRLFLEGEELVEGDERLKPRYDRNRDGYPVLMERPTVGGIDLADPWWHDEDPLAIVVPPDGEGEGEEGGGGPLNGEGGGNGGELSGEEGPSDARAARRAKIAEVAEDLAKRRRERLRGTSGPLGGTPPNDG